jgi:hypothetical protein
MSAETLPSFKVGQIIYLIPTGERRVIPAQVTEEILRRTIAGQETVWMIQLAGSQKSVPLDPTAAEYFTSMDDLRNVLIERTKSQVIAMLEKSERLALELFEAQQDEEPEYDPEEDQRTTVLLPDGTRAKVKI